MKSTKVTTPEDLKKALVENNVEEIEYLRRSGYSYTRELSRDVADALEKNTVLVSFDLSKCDIGPDGAKDLAEALKDNERLLELLLWGSKIGDTGVKHIAEMLEWNRGIQCLVLNDNNIGKDGGEHVANALAHNKTLRVLDLGGNVLGDKGVRALADALTHKHISLEWLRLANNSVGPSGAIGLASALRSNETLLSLDLSENHIRDNGAEELQRALEQNDTLLELDLERCNVAKDIEDKIIRKLEENTQTPKGLANSIKEELARVLIKGAKCPWRRAKLMVVGQGRAGKTSTIKALVGDVFDPKQESTCGILSTKKAKVNMNDPKAGLKQVEKREDWVSQHITTAAYRAYMKKKNKKAMKRKKASVTTDDLFSKFEGSSLKQGATDVHRAEGETDGRKHAVRAAKREGYEARTFSRDYAVALSDGSTGNSIELNIWDYGGQRVFYALHHLFLTKFGVYLLVFDMEKAFNKEEEVAEHLSFWLETIHLHANLASIILVGTHRDKVSEPEQWKEIQKFLETNVEISKFTAVVDQGELSFCPVANPLNEGVDKVVASIRQSLIGSDFVECSVALSWIKCLHSLLEQGENYASLSKVLRVAKACGVVTDGEALKMLHFFHEIGSLLHFRKNKDLCTTVFLEPQWLIDAMSCLIFDSTVHVHETSSLDAQDSLMTDELEFITRGILSEKLRKRRWSNGGYSKNTHPMLLALMEDMLLLCKWPWHRRPGAYLVPSMLLRDVILRSETEHQIVEKVEQYHPGLSCKIEFLNDFLPDGLFQRLVCLCASYSQGFGDNSHSAPKVGGRAAFMRISSDIDLGMKYSLAAKKIFVVISEDPVDPTAPARLVKHLNSMLRGLRDNFVGAGLEWKLKLINKELEGLKKDEKDVRKKRLPAYYADYEDIMKMMSSDPKSPKGKGFKVGPIVHWRKGFEKWLDIGSDSLGNLLEDKTRDQLAFEDNVRRKGVKVATVTMKKSTKGVELKPKPRNSNAEHCFISYKHTTGGEIALTLYYELTMRGYDVWHDMSRKEELSRKAMLDGVTNSALYVLVLSKGVFRSESVLKELRTARELDKPIIIVQESNPESLGFSYFSEYASTLPEDLKGPKGLFEEFEVIDHERRCYKLVAVIDEIDKRIREKLRLET